MNKKSLAVLVGTLVLAFGAKLVVAENLETTVSGAQTSVQTEVKSQKALAVVKTAELKVAHEAMLKAAVMSTEVEAADAGLLIQVRNPGRRLWCEQRYRDCNRHCHRRNHRCQNQCEWEFRRCMRH
jgi:hypothetical protein